MPLRIGSGHAESQEAVREARRLLTSKLRNDWDYPTLEDIAEPWSSQDDLLRRSKQEAVQTQEHTQHEPNASLSFEPVSWQERDYSSSDGMNDSDFSASDSMDLDPARRPVEGIKIGADGQADLSENMARTVLSRPQNSRKRKRAQLLESEMSWNAGLAHFVARRNAWTCARQVTKSDGSAVKHKRSVEAKTDEGLHAESSSLSSISVNTSEARSDPFSNEEPRGTASSSSLQNDTQRYSHENRNQPIIKQNASPSNSRTLLPIPPSLLPDHPIRKRISPSAYSEIYSKIILQGRTPTVPINLSHITSALIQGWKEEGNWPPKPSLAEAPIAARRRKKPGGGEDGVKHPHLRKGVQAVSRVLGLGAKDCDRNGHAGK